MSIKIALVASIIAGSVCSLSAQTGDLFRVTFKASCFAPNSSTGSSSTSKLSEKDIIAKCVGSTASTHNLTKNYALVYDPAANVMRVVRLSDGAFLCDVIQFQDVATASDSKQTQQFAFMFVPDDTNSIGTAIITQKSNNNNNNGNFSGKVQFVLTGDMALGGTNAPFGTNQAATTNGIMAALTAVEFGNTGATSGTASGTTSTSTTASNSTAVTATNVAGITDTNLANLIASNNAAAGLGVANTNTVATTTNSLGTALGTTFGTTTTSGTSNNVFTIGAPAITTPGVSVFSTTNSVADTNVITSDTNAASGIDTNAVASNPSATITDTNGVTTNSIAATNLTNVRICSGTFTASRRVTLGGTSNNNNNNNNNNGTNTTSSVSGTTGTSTTSGTTVSGTTSTSIFGTSVSGSASGSAGGTSGSATGTTGTSGTSATTGGTTGTTTDTTVTTTVP